MTAPPAKGTKKTVTGDTTTTERHGEFSEDLIDVDGDVTTKESRTQAGYGTKVASEIEIFDGTTTTTDASMWQGFAGAERSAKVISEASDDVLKEAIEVMARVGVFGEAEASKAIKRGGFSAKMDGAASGKIGAEVYGSASVEVRGVIDGMTVLAAVGVQVGAQGSIAGQIAAGYGPLEARLKGRLEGFAGAMANASGSFDIGLIRGINIAGTVQAKAGAEGTAAVEAGVKVGEVDLSAELSATGFAGGKALGMGKIGLSMAGVELGGKASAFAGLETAFKGKAALTHRGKAVASAKGAVVVQVGIGGTIGGEFSFKNGKLVIEGEIAVALGIGGGIEFAATVDFKEIATAVVLIISDALKAKQAEINRKSPGEPRPICLDGDEVRDKAYTTVHRDFMAYGAKKDQQGAHGVKRERVQKIIDKHHLGALADDMLFIECDEGIRKALLDAYGPNLKDVIVQVGQIRAWVYDE